MGESVWGLAAAVESLRGELMQAMGEGAGQLMRFGLEPVELTLQLLVTKGLDGKLGWKVLEFGGKRESQTTHSLTLRLTPLWAGPQGLTRDFTIAAAGPAGQHFGPRPPAAGPGSTVPAEGS